MYEHKYIRENTVSPIKIFSTAQECIKRGGDESVLSNPFVLLQLCRSFPAIIANSYYLMRHFPQVQLHPAYGIYEVKAQRHWKITFFTVRGSKERKGQCSPESLPLSIKSCMRQLILTWRFLHAAPSGGGGGTGVHLQSRWRLRQGLSEPCQTQTIWRHYLTILCT